MSLFTDGNEIVENYTVRYDIILMDIEMPVMDGMSAAERIRRVDEKVVVVFITNMPQFVMKGYTVDALDYVLKSVSSFSFSQRIQRAIGRMRRRTEEHLMVPVRPGIAHKGTHIVWNQKSHPRRGEYAADGYMIGTGYHPWQ